MIILIFLCLKSFAEDNLEVYKRDDLVSNIDGLIDEYSNIKTVKINTYSQVVQNSFNYRGEGDLSGEFGLVLYKNDLIVFGKVRDNIPLYQTREKPINPKWWKITYGADGVCFLLSKSEKKEDINKIILNFGSQGLNPVIVLDKFPDEKSETSSGKLVVKKTQDGYTFEARIPIQELSDGALVGNGRDRSLQAFSYLEILLYDMDGDEATYKVMALKSKVEADLENPLKWLKMIVKK